MLIPFDYLFRKYGIKSKGALHLGAHCGEEAEAYHKNGIEKVIWVEANPSCIITLTKHVSRWPQDSVYCACIGDKDGERVTFHYANNQGQSSSILEFGTHAKEHPTVKFISQDRMTTQRMDTLLTGQIGKGWFLNVDLQGAELMALKGMGELLWRFDHAYIEVNEKELYKGCPLVGEIDAYLAQFGLHGKETKMTKHGWGDRYYGRRDNRT